MISLRPWQKWVWGIIGTIALGAIGSGLWQRVGDPLYVFVRDALLNLATLGLGTLKNALYADVASGLHEDASIQTFTLLLTALFGFMVYRLLTTTSLVRELATELVDMPSVEASIPSMRTLKVLLYVMWVTAILMVAMFGFRLIRADYTAQAVANYQ
jgi:hypothetical protein